MQQSHASTDKDNDRPFKHICGPTWPGCFLSQGHRITDKMPKTMLQTLGQLVATGRNYLSKDSSRRQTSASQRTTCRLTVHRTKTGMIVFKVIGPGSKYSKHKSPPCGHGDCWVCGKLMGKSFLCRYPRVPELRLEVNIRILLTYICCGRNVRGRFGEETSWSEERRMNLRPAARDDVPVEELRQSIYLSLPRIYVGGDPEWRSGHRACLRLFNATPRSGSLVILQGR